MDKIKQVTEDYQLSDMGLIAACDVIAESIIESLPYEGDIALPRGYSKRSLTHWDNGTEYTSRALVNETYMDAPGFYAINHTKCQYAGSEFINAPRHVLLQFAKDCDTGLIEEIVQQIKEATLENENATLKIRKRLQA